MKPLRWVTLAATAGGVAVVSFVLTGLVLRLGHTPLLLHPAVGVLLIVGAAVLVRLGWSVRRLRRHEPTRMSPLQAAQVAAAAQAARMLAAIICGHALAQLALSLTRVEAAALAQQALGSALALVGGVILLVAGTIVERWCTIGDDEDDDRRRPGKGRGAGVRPSAA